MKIIEPSFEILTPFGSLTPEIGVQMLKFIERLARISHRSEDKQTEDSWKRFIDAVVVKHGDWSVTEHCSLSVIFRVDRGVTHEIVRHRLFSFTQESTRFVRYREDLDFIYPAESPNPDYCPDFQSQDWMNAVNDAENRYHTLLEKGWRPQEARSVLPNALASTIAVTGNLRSWRWLLLARTTKETHPDFARVAVPLLEEIKKNVPLLYDDIEPLQKQSISMAKAH